MFLPLSYKGCQSWQGRWYICKGWSFWWFLCTLEAFDSGNFEKVDVSAALPYIMAPREELDVVTIIEKACLASIGDRKECTMSSDEDALEFNDESEAIPGPRPAELTDTDGISHWKLL